MKNAVYLLFPYPLMVCGESYAFSDAESAFMDGLAMSSNIGNARSTDDRVLDRAELSGVRQLIERELNLYTKNLLQFRDDNEIYITQSWVNRSAPGEFHPRHKHPNSIVSGVLFLDDNADADLPPIQFHRTSPIFPLDLGFESLNESNATGREFDPEPGMLMLFPSLLEHEVGRNDSTRIRKSLSFNTFVRGRLGGRDALTEVDLD